MNSDVNSERRNEVFVWLILLALIVFGLTLAYKFFKPEINLVLIKINNVFLIAIGFFSEQAQNIYAKVNSKPSCDFTLSNIVAQYGYVGQYFKWIVSAILCIMGVHLIRGVSPKQKYRKNFSIEKLLEHNVDEFPCIAPVVGKNLLKEDPDKGPWKTVRQPIQFAAENNLLLDAKTHKPIQTKTLLNKNNLANLNSPVLRDNNNQNVILDAEKTYQIFENQLKKRFLGFDNLEDYEKGLAAAFLAFGHGKREKAQELLDQMSLSFQEGKDIYKLYFSKKFPFVNRIHAGNTYKIDISGAEKIIEDYKESEGYNLAVQKHNVYVPTWFHALKVFADQKGVFPPAQFLWLRPLDRTLWYTLNQIGGRTAWVEASGPWAHYYAEETLGQAIETPEIDEAVKAYENILISQGWLPKEDDE